MADIIVQPKVLNADGVTYDSLIMQNAVNAIKKDDNSGYNGLTQNVTSGAISTTDGYIVFTKQKLNVVQEGLNIFSSGSSYDFYDVEITEQLQIGDKIEVVVNYGNSNKITKIFKFDGIIIASLSALSFNLLYNQIQDYTSNILVALGLCCVDYAPNTAPYKKLRFRLQWININGATPNPLEAKNIQSIDIYKTI